MMNKFRNLVLLFAVFVSNALFAQNPPPPPVLPDTPGPGLPIDSNILILIVLALVLGSVTAIRKYKKN